MTTSDADAAARRKPANGAAPPPALADLSPHWRALFEADFQRAARTDPAYRKAGRAYVALGYRLALQTFVLRHRRRKLRPSHLASIPVSPEVDPPCS